MEGFQQGLKKENNSNYLQHSSVKCCQFTGLTLVCFHTKSQQEANKQLTDSGKAP